MLRYGAGIAGALLVLALGKWFASRQKPSPAAELPAAAAPASLPGRLKRVLLAVDGSETAERAVRHLLAMRDGLREPIDVQLVNVQRPVSSDVSSFVAKDQLQEFQNERCDTALAPSKKLLDEAGLAYQEHRKVGSPGPTIAELAKSLGCDLIVMGARGIGSNTAALLGSVTQSTIEHSAVPVLVVK
jgi:nucleotide-binding universal stress UspA family protein